MKTNVAFVKSLLLVGSLVMVAPIFGKPPAKPAPTPAPAASAADGEEAEPVIPGMSVERKNGKGGYLGITVENGSLKIAFYDAKKKQVPCDVARAAAHWRPKYKPTEERTIFNPSGDGMTLESTNVRPPYIFKMFLTLLSDDDQALESYTIDVHQ